MAHAVVGAVVAQASGNSALADAAGAASASAATSVIAKTLYGTDDYSRLDETQKQTISALSTLAGGLAGGLTGDSVASAVSGAQAGKNTPETMIRSACRNLALLLVFGQMWVVLIYLELQEGRLKMLLISRRKISEKKTYNNAFCINYFIWLGYFFLTGIVLRLVINFFM